MASAHFVDYWCLMTLGCVPGWEIYDSFVGDISTRQLGPYGDSFDMKHVAFVSDIIKIGIEQESRLGGQTKILNEALKLEADNQAILSYPCQPNCCIAQSRYYGWNQ
ncbi:predicted protein [Lichtheimia corymbifera JMRC:FSU:9682]|uniref:Uncharacterized protein n=1 Tax=Lichtheimia corymbifera JMRC:FSU:9682 TaxID=1263082 RepID=A0A068RXN6_9FUNG|nr:predicted protein [Lichtheimia corymbifera JMRC:FSU:9682]